MTIREQPALWTNWRLVIVGFINRFNPLGRFNTRQITIDWLIHQSHAQLNDLINCVTYSSMNSELKLWNMITTEPYREHCACMCIRVCVRAHVCVRMCACTSVCVCVCTHTCVRACMHASACRCACVCKTYMWLCIHPFNKSQKWTFSRCITFFY